MFREACQAITHGLAQGRTELAVARLRDTRSPLDPIAATVGYGSGPGPLSRRGD